MSYPQERRYGAASTQNDLPASPSSTSSDHNYWGGEANAGLTTMYPGAFDDREGMGAFDTLVDRPGASREPLRMPQYPARDALFGLHEPDVRRSRPQNDHRRGWPSSRDDGRLSRAGNARVFDGYGELPDARQPDTRSQYSRNFDVYDESRFHGHRRRQAGETYIDGNVAYQDAFLGSQAPGSRHSGSSSRDQSRMGRAGAVRVFYGYAAPPDSRRPSTRSQYSQDFEIYDESGSNHRRRPVEETYVSGDVEYQYAQSESSRRRRRRDHDYYR